MRTLVRPHQSGVLKRGVLGQTFTQTFCDLLCCQPKVELSVVSVFLLLSCVPRYRQQLLGTRPASGSGDDRTRHQVGDAFRGSRERGGGGEGGEKTHRERKRERERNREKETARHTETQTQTHTQRERERKRDRERFRGVGKEICLPPRNMRPCFVLGAP